MDTKMKKKVPITMSHTPTAARLWCSSLLNLYSNSYLSL